MAPCGVGNAVPCDSIKRVETKTGWLEGVTYKHTMYTQWLGSEESVGYHQATFGVVARFKVVA